MVSQEAARAAARPLNPIRHDRFMKPDFTAAYATARRQRKLVAMRQPGDLGGLGCAPTNRPLAAGARCRIDGFRVEGGLDTSADWTLANDCRGGAAGAGETLTLS